MNIVIIEMYVAVNLLFQLIFVSAFVFNSLTYITIPPKMEKSKLT